MRVVHVLRKPLGEASVAANVLKHGTGALNVDGTRIHSGPSVRGSISGGTAFGQGSGWNAHNNRTTDIDRSMAAGRWPANLLLEHRPGCRMTGVRRVSGTGTAVNRNRNPAKSHQVYGEFSRMQGHDVGYADENGMETIDAWDCEPGCPVADLDAQSGPGASPTASRPKTTGTDFGIVNDDGWQPSGCTIYGYGDAGGASRFFKQVGGADE